MGLRLKPGVTCRKSTPPLQPNHSIPVWTQSVVHTCSRHCHSIEKWSMLKSLFRGIWQAVRRWYHISSQEGIIGEVGEYGQCWTAHSLSPWLHISAAWLKLSRPHILFTYTSHGRAAQREGRGGTGREDRLRGMSCPNACSPGSVRTESRHSCGVRNHVHKDKRPSLAIFGSFVNENWIDLILSFCQWTKMCCTFSFSSL